MCNYSRLWLTQLLKTLLDVSAISSLIVGFKAGYSKRGVRSVITNKTIIFFKLSFVRAISKLIAARYLW